MQLDLFAPAAQVYVPPSDAEDRLGWEHRCLSDLAAGPRTYCFPGFMGAVCERLVEKGFATRASAGFMDPVARVHTPSYSPAKLKRYVRDYWKDPFPQFTYTITPAGRVHLPEVSPHG